MNRTKQRLLRFPNTLIFTVTFVFTIAFANPLLASDPFTPTTDVCPTCKDTTHDTIELTSGEKIKATIVDTHDGNYIMTRFGEFKTIPQQEVKNIEWLNGTQRHLKSRDLIITKSKKLFSGNIVKDVEKPAYYVIQIPELGQEITIFKSEVEKLRKKDGNHI